MRIKILGNMLVNEESILVGRCVKKALSYCSLTSVDEIVLFRKR